MADDLTPSEMLTAACSGDIEKVMKLLHLTNTEQSENDNRARLNVRNNEGETALHLAIHQDNVTGIQTLLRAGTEINLRNKKEETALMVAIKQGKSSCARQLIDLGANIDCVDKEGRNALMLAAAKGEEECLQILIEAGADLNLQSKRKYDGMLEHKLSVYYEDASLFLFGTNRDLYVQSKREYTGNDYCGPTALMSAAGNVQVSCLKLLLQGGADANVKTSNGETALMWVAEMAGSPSISTSAVAESVRILVNSGADVNARNADGQTALNLTVKEAIREFYGRINVPAVTECVKILIDSNADVTINGYEGETALSYAARSDLLVDILPILTEAGAVVDHQNSIGMTALSYAVQSGNHRCKCVRWLVDSGASVNIRDHSGKTPLHYLFYDSASDYIAEQCLEIILTKMPDLNAADSDGVTPLMNAAKHAVGTNTIAMLLNHGADLNLSDNLGQTALIHSLATEHLCLDVEDEPFLTCGNSALFNVLFLLDNGAKFNIGQLGTGCPSMLAAFTYDLDLVNLKIGKEVNLQASAYQFSSVIHKDHKRTLQFFIINGMMPSQPRMEYTFCYANDTDTIYRASSVLDAAAKSGRLGITKYLVATCYLCSSDLTLFTAGSPNWSIVSKNQDISTVMKNLHRQPWPLVKLCFVAVSTVFGASPGRQERVKNSQLPVQLQTMLLFQEPWSRLCVHQWDKIPLTFSPEKYEKLPRPRPLLYNWPVGRELIPCDCGQCDGTVFKYEHNEQEQ